MLDKTKSEIPFYKRVAINLQNKTRAEKGTVEKYWFEGENVGLENRLFHRVIIPLKPFYSRCEYEQQPLNTALVIEFLRLNLQMPNELDEIIISAWS